MRLSDEMPLDPLVAAELEAIDLALAGEPVDPEYAELVELSLLVADERLRPRPEFARSLDERAARRFALEPAPAGAGGRSGARGSGSTRLTFRAVLSRPAFHLGVAALAAAALFVFVISGASPGGSSSSSTNYNGSSTSSATTSATSSASGIAASSLGASSQERAKRPASAPEHLSSNTAGSDSTAGASGSAATPVTGSPAATTAAPTPSTTGRKVVQSAQLSLQTPEARIDTVAQEVYDVVSAQNGIVLTSHVTSVSGNANEGSATFQLSIPSANLEAALGSLSSLRYAQVLSRSDSTHDVTGTYNNDQKQLQDALALRTSLLKQLAEATTDQEIDSIKAQLQDAESQIASAQSTVNQVQRSVSYSNVFVQLNAGSQPAPAHHHAHSAGGFTLGRAAHDAGRVLVVAAGVMLIVLAALVPIGLVAALIAWLVVWLRQRRREQALDGH